MLIGWRGSNEVRLSRLPRLKSPSLERPRSFCYWSGAVLLRPLRHSSKAPLRHRSLCPIARRRVSPRCHQYAICRHRPSQMSQCPHVVYCYLFAHVRLLCFTIWLRHVLPSIYTPSSLGCISLALISQVISSPTLYLQIVGQHRMSKTL